MTDYLDIDEVGRFITTASSLGARDELICRMLLFTGMRIGECVPLACGDVNVEKGSVSLSKVITTPTEMMATKKVTSKGKVRHVARYAPDKPLTFLVESETRYSGEKFSMLPGEAAKKYHHVQNEMVKLGLKASQPTRVVPLVDRSTLALLGQWVEGKHQRDYLFVSQKPHSHKLKKAEVSYRLGKWQMSKIVKNAMLQSGIDSTKAHPHNIRHTYAVHQLKKGMDIVTLQRILGHTKISTTSIYLRFVVDDLIEKAKKSGDLYAKGS